MSIELFSKDERTKLCEEIIAFFKTERNEEIGIIAAEELLDFFMESVGKKTYNKAVDKTMSFCKEQFDRIELDVEGIKK